MDIVIPLEKDDEYKTKSYIVYLYLDLECGYLNGFNFPSKNLIVSALYMCFKDISTFHMFDIILFNERFTTINPEYLVANIIDLITSKQLLIGVIVSEGKKIKDSYGYDCNTSITVKVFDGGLDSVYYANEFINSLKPML